MPGFDIKLTVKNTKCDAEDALADFVGLQSKPDVIVGFGCSSVALALQPTAAAMRIPTVGVDVRSGLLSNKKRFVRFTYSLDEAGQLGAAIARSIHLRSIGAVLTDQWRSVTNNLASAAHNTTSCGSVLLGNEQLRTGLAKLFVAGCRCECAAWVVWLPLLVACLLTTFSLTHMASSSTHMVVGSCCTWLVRGSWLECCWQLTPASSHRGWGGWLLYGLPAQRGLKAGYHFALRSTPRSLCMSRWHRASTNTGWKTSSGAGIESMHRHQPRPPAKHSTRYWQ